MARVAEATKAAEVMNECIVMKERESVCLCGLSGGPVMSFGNGEDEERRRSTLVAVLVLYVCSELPDEGEHVLKHDTDRRYSNHRVVPVMRTQMVAQAADSLDGQGIA